MILKSVHITNYKIVKDSEPFTVDPKVTALVGKNESGKTAILHAMEKLNPIDSNKGAFDELEYPRAEMSEYQESEEVADAIRTVWELSDQDAEAVRAIVGPDALDSTEIEIKKGYYESRTWTIKIDEEKAFHNLLAETDLHDEERKALAATGSLKSAYDLLKSRPAHEGEAGTGEPRSSREQALFNRIEAFGEKKRFWQPVANELQKRLPKMVYFNEYYRMPGQVSLSDLEGRPAAKHDPGNQVFLALLAMIRRKPEDLKSIGEFERLQAELEAASNRLTTEVFQYWTQNKNLRVQFRFEQGLTGDAPPFNSGYVMRTRIENLRHRVTTSFDERSTGFVWFFSFLVWFSQVRKTYGQNLIILLDEPGLSLHAKAQADLLRYIEERLAPKYQVIYTTHSPFMIDPANLLRVRTVDDVYLPEIDGQPEQDLGTKVGDEVLSPDRDTLFPLQACLGYEITQTLFMGEHSLLVEGPAEILYLPWFSRKLESKNRTGLDPRWTLTPCGGIDKIPAFLSLFAGQKLHIATLFDYATGHKGKVEQMRKSELLKGGHVFTADQYAGQAEADIEDIIGRSTYIDLVNECYGLTGAEALPKTKATDAPIRVVQDVELKFPIRGDDEEEFNHYRPAEYLTQQGLDVDLVDLDKALDRFEKLFADLNSLLPDREQRVPAPHTKPARTRAGRTTK